MGAIFSGRHPIQNAIVPGGVSTLFTQADINSFRSKLNGIRNFINSYYIPDVVFVASATVPRSVNWNVYWTVGSAPNNLLSYGEYPLAGGEAPFETVLNANMLLKRGALVGTLGATIDDTADNLSLADIKEYVDYSFYTQAALNPASGVTVPLTSATTPTLANAMLTGPQYSWLKAPRYKGYAMEVGPLARMVVSYVVDDTSVTADDTAGGITGCTLLRGPGGMTNPYTAKQIVTAAITGVNAVANGVFTIGAGNLYSPLGRHAARALECKFVADAMYGWLDELTLNNLMTATTDAHNSVAYATSVQTGSGYSYVKIPKATVHGTGLAEAPRGALGHWITIQNQKIANYQCVVPSTWNCGPKAISAGETATNAFNGFSRGPAEAALFSLGVPAGSGANATNNAICNIARMLHPYDFCIACAVHVVTPEGKDIAKFKMDLDGKVTKLPFDSE